ncbi:MAG TPA: MoaD/ThiS family protein [Acidimicrobiales bacterium]|nr:MoaD/ThiS family protein [Acidimicrobiales bacterium]
MARLRLFAQAREIAGTAGSEIPGATVDAVLAAAVARFGAEFDSLLAHCAVWVNGEPADRTTQVGPGDEVAVLPPVSGG